MRLAHLAIAGSMLGVMLAGTTFAQSPATTDLNQPTSVQQTAFEYDNYLYFAPQEGANGGQAAAAAPAKKEAAAPATASSDSYYYSAPCRRRIFDPDVTLGEPWTMPQPCALQCRGIKVGGWVSAGVTTNEYDATTNGTMGMRSDKHLNLDQLWMYAERQTDGSEGWDVGGRVDYLFGVDGPDTQAFGDRSYDYGWTSSYDHAGNALYGSALPQAYAEVANGNWKIKIGHFYTPMGNEVVPATGNFFYTHSYMSYYAEPFTHTGFLASYKFSDKLTAFGGWADGWDSGFNVGKNDGSMLLTGLTYAMNERANLAWYMCTGYLGNGSAYTGAPSGTMNMNSFVFSYKLTERWTYTFQGDYATTFNLANENSWYGIANYLTYKINDKWSFGGRVEWFRDDDGLRVIAGNEGSYTELTAGVNWKPKANLTFRPEVRYDAYSGTVAGGKPFNDGASNHQTSAAFDAIFTF